VVQPSRLPEQARRLHHKFGKGPLMMNILAAATFWERFWHADFLYAAPLVIALSLVYAATRHEDLKAIFGHALRMGATIAVFMATIFVILWFFSRRL
jgi:hypothetical protein